MSANIKNENIDLTCILKDVENCIRSGLSNKLDTFFYEYDKYKKTHEEVLNLSIVKELLKNSSYTPSHSSQDTKPKLDPELEMIVLRSQVMHLRGEVNKYKSQVEEQSQRQTKIVTIKPEYSHINLEVKEEEREPLDIKSENEDEYGDGDISIASDSSDTSDSSNTSDSDSIEDNIQNIVLNVTEKDDHGVESDNDEEEEVTVKGEYVSTAVEIHCYTSDSEEEENMIKSLDVSEEEEEEEEEEEDIVVKMPTFPTKKIDEVKSVIEETKTEEQTEEDVEQDNIDPEYDVETETEEDSDEEQATETIPDMKTLEVKVETETEVAQDENKDEDKGQDEDEEEEEEELYEVEINGVVYVTNDDEDGTIYSYINEEVGDKVGEFKGLVAHIYNGKNKGIYDRTKCKLNF
jgi:hypothetical protein